MSPSKTHTQADSGFTSGLMLGGALGAVLVWLFGTTSGRKQKEKLRSNGITLLDELEKYFRTKRLPPQAKKEWRQLKRTYSSLKNDFSVSSSTPTKTQTATPKTSRTKSAKKSSSKATIKRKFTVKKK